MICVYDCICIYDICVYVYMCTVYMYICVYVYMCQCVYTCVHVCVCANIYIHVCVVDIYAFVCACMHICVCRTFENLFEPIPGTNAMLSKHPRNEVFNHRTEDIAKKWPRLADMLLALSRACILHGVS